MTQPDQPIPDRPEPDEDVPTERVGRGRRTEPVDLEIPPTARTMRNLRDRKRHIE